MNDYITAVLDAATDPNLAESLAESVRDRLRRAGLLVDPAHPGGDAPLQLVDAERLAAARRRAGRGTPLAQLVADGR